MKPGRNDPCPCGSGKKYKHCCLAKSEAIAPEELIWRRVRRATDHLADELLREAKRHFGEVGLDEAWHEFALFDIDEPRPSDSDYATLFFTWFLYDWLPDPDDSELPPSAHGLTVAQAYLNRMRSRIDPLARRFVEACAAAPFSFHEVLDCRPGHGLRLRDVLLGTEIDVIEKTASKTLNRGDIVFAKVVPIEGIALLEGVGPIAIPPGRKPDLIELRSALGLQQNLFRVETLRARAHEIREAYLAIAETLRNPALPQLRNTDGDPIELHTLIFELDAPEAAVERLADLAAGVEEPDVERDAEGRFVRAELVWAKVGNATYEAWDNTVLGNITIEGTRLTAEVNSARRAETLRELIEQRLGATARAKPSVVQSAQSLLGRAPTAAERAQRQQTEREHAELAARPEVQAALQEYLRKHYRAWVDEPLPVLGNRSPRQAVSDPDGREAVEALILEIERRSGHMTPALDPDIVRELRATLGLNPA